MSLINQALKKEQQRRSLNLREATADIPVYDSNATGNGLSPSRQKRNNSLSILLGLTGAGVVLLGLGGGFIYFGKAYLSGLTATSPTEEASEQPTFASSPFASNPVNEILDDVDSLSAGTPATVADSEPDQAPPSGEMAALAIDSNPDSEAINADTASTADPSANPETAHSEEMGEEAVELVEAVPEEPQFDFKIQDFVDGLQVFGFRSAGVNTRLLLGGRVFKLDDVVDNERGLVFRGSDGENLIFEAPSGHHYKKPL